MKYLTKFRIHETKYTIEYNRRVEVEQNTGRVEKLTASEIAEFSKTTHTERYTVQVKR